MRLRKSIAEQTDSVLRPRNLISEQTASVLKTQLRTLGKKHPFSYKGLGMKLENEIPGDSDHWDDSKIKIEEEWPYPLETEQNWENWKKEILEFFRKAMEAEHHQAGNITSSMAELEAGLDIISFSSESTESS